jgi:hypothetical protein
MRYAMWLIALLLLVSPQAVPTTTKPPSLIVQLVDPTWDPLPGADVTVKPLSGKVESSVAHTDKDGYAKFWVAGDNDYAIEAKLTGFKTKRLKHVHLFKPTATSPTAYIQLQLKLSGPTTTVY